MNHYLLGFLQPYKALCEVMMMFCWVFTKNNFASIVLLIVVNEEGQSDLLTFLCSNFVFKPTEINLIAEISI